MDLGSYPETVYVGRSPALPRSRIDLVLNLSLILTDFQPRRPIPRPSRSECEHVLWRTIGRLSEPFENPGSKTVAIRPFSPQCKGSPIMLFSFNGALAGLESIFPRTPPPRTASPAPGARVGPTDPGSPWISVGRVDELVPGPGDRGVGPLR